MRIQPLAFVALLAVLAACGDDSTDNNGNNNTSTNNVSDAGTSDVGNTDAGPVDMTMPDDTGTEPDLGDPCADVTCSDRGTCVADGQGYTCTCDPGWAGDDCEACAPDRACGESCCTEEGSVCRAGQCVVPTATVCSRAIPCADGQYCDTELEAGDALYIPQVRRFSFLRFAVFALLRSCFPGAHKCSSSRSSLSHTRCGLLASLARPLLAPRSTGGTSSRALARRRWR